MSSDNNTLEDEVYETDTDADDKGDDEEILDESQADEPVKIRGRDGIVRTYLLREMDGDGLGKWTEVVTRKLKSDKTGKAAAKKDYSGLHAELIYLNILTEDGNKVPKDKIRKWGARTQSVLFSKCRRLNGLGQEAVDQEGKG